MSLIVKIMSDEDTADHDTRKSFILHAGVKSAVFERLPAYDGQDSGAPSTPERPWLTLIFGLDDSEAFQPRGNVYVMNENGKTIATYGIAPIIYAGEGNETDPNKWSMDKLR